MLQCSLRLKIRDCLSIFNFYTIFIIIQDKLNIIWQYKLSFNLHEYITEMKQLLFVTLETFEMFVFI